MLVSTVRLVSVRTFFLSIARHVPKLSVKSVSMRALISLVVSEEI